MNDQVKQFIQITVANPLWAEFVAHVKKQRPVVTAYTPGLSREETDHAIERIKYESGLRAGFDIALLHFTGDK